MRGFLEAGKNSLGDARIPQGWQELPGDFLEETRIHTERGYLVDPSSLKGEANCRKGVRDALGRQGFTGRDKDSLGEA